MLIQIVSRTPLWVWGLLLVLISIGLSQLFTRTVSAKRITLMSAAMTALSLYGTLSAFGSMPHILLGWLAAAVAAAWLVLQRPLSAHTRYNTATRQFTVPGSWVPLVLIMGIFLTKYVVGVALSMQPALAQHTGFGLGFGSLYGAFSGAFIARAARLWRLALSHKGTHANAVHALQTRMRTDA
jgi:hypothetical protein